MKFSASVAFLIYNRPKLTKKVFLQIRKVKPKSLFVIADGPNPKVANDDNECYLAREITKKVDWDCCLKKNFSSKHLGCKRRVSSGLDWVFKKVKKAIILEDDCFPNLSFFSFCEKLLEKYCNNKQIMMISGSNPLSKWNSNKKSYFFSYFGSIWGWATWRRAWKYYDVKMKLWQKKAFRNKFRENLNDERHYQRVKPHLDKVFQGKLDTWDFQWFFSRVLNKGLSILPSQNLISNIGYNQKATHTKGKKDKRANLPTTSLSFPLTHPKNIFRDGDFETAYFNKFFKKKKNKNFITYFLKIIKNANL